MNIYWKKENPRLYKMFHKMSHGNKSIRRKAMKILGCTDRQPLLNEQSILNFEKDAKNYFECQYKQILLEDLKILKKCHKQQDECLILKKEWKFN